MASFALAVTRTDSDPEAGRLLDRVQNGPDEGRRQALETLVQYAERDGTPDVWNAAGVGFHFAGLHDQATRLFDSLVQAIPDNDYYRLNLATSLSQTAQVDLCRHHLRHVVQYGSTEETRKFANGQLQGYENFLGLSERDRKLRELQIASLRQSVQQPGARPEAYLSLARVLVQRSMQDPSGTWLGEAASVLEKGRAAFPAEPHILELLIACYLRHDPQNRLEDAISQLERIAPHSPVLQHLTDATNDQAREFVEQNAQRARDLLDTVCNSGSNAAAREAALNDLGRIVAMYPNNPDYRVTYSFALMAAGREEAALAQARTLADMPISSHSFHFNLGQIFWGCGDRERGRHHLNLALQYAENEQDRQDARERILDLEQTRP
jgi:tetratricopeptide (TPR) repeat protein